MSHRLHAQAGILAPEEESLSLKTSSLKLRTLRPLPEALNPKPLGGCQN